MTKTKKNTFASQRNVYGKIANLQKIWDRDFLIIFSSTCKAV